jgi:V/A-type H+/Na+-transporting ATPase subunit D
MAEQVIKVRPTKIEYIKLKRRLALAKRVQKIMKEKISILTLEFLQVVKETAAARKRFLEKLSEANQDLSIAQGYHGSLALQKELAAIEGDVPVILCSRSIAGVRIPSFQLLGGGKTGRSYSLTDTSSVVDQAADSFKNSLEALIELAELQRSLELLGMEINRTRRIVNALEYFTIPALQNTIRFLYMKFEEQSREEKSRLKRIKVLVQR